MVCNGPFIIDAQSIPGMFYPRDIIIDVGFFPDRTIMIKYNDSFCDPFTDNDRREIIKQVKEFDYMDDTTGDNNHYYLRMLTAINTEATGYVEGRIRLLVIIHRMTVEEFKAIDNWEHVR